MMLSADRDWLLALIPLMQDFLQDGLDLMMHPAKISLETFVSGVDFLGWVEFPYHSVPRTSTKNRLLNRLGQSNSDATLQSYLGLLSHGNCFHLREEVLNNRWLNQL